MRTFYAVAMLIILLSGAAHAGSPEGSGASIEVNVTTQSKPWTSLKLNNDPAVFRFAIVSDNAGGPRPGIYAEAVAKLNLLQPEFVMTTGDLIEGYEDKREQLEAQWTQFMGFIGKLEMPFFFVPGNHDNGRPLWAEVYNAHFGVPYYHFVYKEVLFLCLATNDAPDKGTGISREQVEYVTQVLHEHADVRWTLLFQHKPLWNEEGNQEWKQIEELLKGRKCTAFAGHTHNYMSREKCGISFVTLATTGGGSALRGPTSGDFDEIAWVTMTNEGPRIANLLLDGILDRDFRTPEKAKDLGLSGGARTAMATPIMVESTQFEKGVSQVTITNPAQTPLRVKVLTETPAGMRAEPGTIAAIIPGGGKQVTELHVTSDKPVPATQVQPIVLHWSGFYDSGKNTPSVELGGECVIPIDAPFTVKPRGKAPVIDGKLDDWGDLPFVVDQPADVYTNAPAWKGPQDGSFRFGVSYDDQYLYTAVKTTDNELCFDGWKYWKDFAMVLVDGRGAPTDDAKKSVFSVMAGPNLKPEQVEEYRTGEAPEGVKTASVATANGFEAEIAIPIAYLNERQGGNWRRVHLNLAFSDFDPGDARDGVTILYWRPQWTGRGGQTELGVFQREAPVK